MTEAIMEVDKSVKPQIVRLRTQLVVVSGALCMALSA